MATNFQIFKPKCEPFTNITINNLESQDELQVGDVVSVNDSEYIEAGYSGDMTFVQNTDFIGFNTSDFAWNVDVVMLSDTFGAVGFCSYFGGIAASIVGFNVSASGILTWTNSQAITDSSSTHCISLCKIDSTTCAMLLQRYNGGTSTYTVRVIVFEFNSSTNKFAPSSSQGYSGLSLYNQASSFDSGFNGVIVEMSTNNFLLVFCRSDRLSVAHLEWDGTDINFSGSDPALVSQNVDIGGQYADLISLSSTLAVCLVESIIFTIQISPITIQTPINFNSGMTIKYTARLSKIYIDSVLQTDRFFLTCAYQRVSTGDNYAQFGCIPTITANEVNVINVDDWCNLNYSWNDMDYSNSQSYYSTGFMNGMVAITYRNRQTSSGSAILLVDVTGTTPSISQQLWPGLVTGSSKFIQYPSGNTDYIIYISQATSTYSGNLTSSGGIGAVCKFYGKRLSPGLKNSCVIGIVDKAISTSIYNVIMYGIVNLSGLTPGCMYYATEDGELTTSELSTRRNAYGKVGANRLVGLALTSKQLFVNFINVFPTQI